MHRLATILFQLLCLAPFLFFAQNPYDLLEITSDLPKITHFTKSDFNADSQFWSVCKDSSGIYYFGNNDGALVFDGEHWDKILLPNNSSVRSLTYSSSGKVYAGGYNELGIIEKNSDGSYGYRPLIDELGLDNRNLENLWQVHELGQMIIYRAFNGLVVINNTTATYIPASDSFIGAGIINDIYYVQDGSSGIMAFDPTNMQLSHIFDGSSYNNEEIISFIPAEAEDTMILISKSGNLYKGNVFTKKVELWVSVFSKGQKDNLISAIKKGDTYLLGTLSSKIISLSDHGKKIKTPPAFNNVQDATVLNLFEDQDNLWVLLNNGLDYIEYNPTVSQLFDGASIYDVLIKNSRLYLATNKGFYQADLKPNGRDIQNGLEFIKINAPQGQAWSLFASDDSILGGHNNGLFLINDLDTEKIGKAEGFWKIIGIPTKKDKFLACNYNGLFLVEKKGDSFNILHKIRGFEESTRDILPAGQKNTYWVCHGYKGVYRIKINDDYSRVYAIDHYTDQNGFTSPFNINAYHYNSQIVFTTNSGVYKFNGKNNTFVPFGPLNKVLDTTINTRKIIQNNDTTWVVQDDEIAYFRTSTAKTAIEKDIFLNVKGDLNRGMESILPLKNNKVLIGAKTGLYMYNLNQPSKIEAPTLITKIVRIENREKKTLPVRPLNEKIELPTKTDILRFEYASPKLSIASNKQYSYVLEEIDQNWSPWENISYKEYTHLRPGNYTFKVRSRNLNGDIGKETAYVFTIVPQWYQTNLARFFYICLVLSLIGLGYKVVKRKISYENRKAQIAANKSRKLLELEIEQLKLTQDKIILEEDVILKSKELANYTMQLVNKKHIFHEIQEDLKDLKSLVKSRSPKQKLLDIFRKLHQHKIGEEYMEVFDINFERIHHNFFEKLTEINPKLTKRELRLCAFIKMDLANKEISPLLNISVRGVETARYRVRKKLGIEHESNFHEFLIAI
ncbi:MAG: triple tyrosine motif-containing protein [Saonia sp.]